LSLVREVFGVPTSTLSNVWKFSSPFVANVVEGVLVFLVFLLLARFLRNLINRLLQIRHVSTEAVQIATRAIYIGVIAIGATLFVGAILGNNTVGVAGVLLAALLTSLGLQDLIKSYVSGFYVLMEKNVRVGDLVESGGYTGVVTDVRMRVTYLRGAHGEVVVVPNSELFTRTLVVSHVPAGWGSPSGLERAEHDPDEGLEVIAR
jgi:small conductance mechanosensitive channel